MKRLTEEEERDLAKEYTQYLRSKEHAQSLPLIVPLRMRPECVSCLLLDPRFQMWWDSIDLMAMAKVVTKGLLPITSREMAIALLLSNRDAAMEAMQSSRFYRTNKRVVPGASNLFHMGDDQHQKRKPQ